MKPIKLSVIIAVALAMLIGCTQTIEPKTGCVLPADGALHELPSSCFNATVTATNDFSIYLDSVAISSGQTLEVIAKAADVSENSGWKLAFTGGTSGKVRLSRLGTAQAMDSATFDTSDGQSWCFDIHSTENPNHIVFWKGTCGNTITAGQWGNAQFNSNEQNASAGNHDARSSANYGSGMTACGGTGTCFTNTGDPTGTKVLYKADKATTSAITVKAARTSGL